MYMHVAVFADGNENPGRLSPWSRVQIDSLCSQLSAFLSEARIWAPASDYDEWLATTEQRELVENKRAPYSARQQVERCHFPSPSGDITLKRNGFVVTYFFAREN